MSIDNSLHLYRHLLFMYLKKKFSLFYGDLTEVLSSYNSPPGILFVQWVCSHVNIPLRHSKSIVPSPRKANY